MKLKKCIVATAAGLCSASLAYAGVGIGINTSTFSGTIWSIALIIGGWIIAGAVAYKITEYRLGANTKGIEKAEDAVAKLAADTHKKLYKNGIPLYQTVIGCKVIKDEMDQRRDNGRRAVCERIEKLEGQVSGIAESQRRLAETVSGHIGKIDQYLEDRAREEKGSIADLTLEVKNLTKAVLEKGED